jgi:hypothetical protein
MTRMSNEADSDPFAAFRKRRQPRDGAPVPNGAATIAPTEPASAERIAELDEGRHHADKLAARGYDVDCTAPSHGEWAERNGHVCAVAAESEKPRSPAEIITS